jgi:hypothetical protein
MQEGNIQKWNPPQIVNRVLKENGDWIVSKLMDESEKHINIVSQFDLYRLLILCRAVAIGAEQGMLMILVSNVQWYESSQIMCVSMTLVKLLYTIHMYNCTVRTVVQIGTYIIIAQRWCEKKTLNLIIGVFHLRRRILALRIYQQCAFLWDIFTLLHMFLMYE